MESIPSNVLFEFKPDTLQYIRKQYDLDKPERMNESIDIMQEWIKKQAHFEKKTYSRDYLERLIIYNKGSIEKCKRKLDCLCTLRTLVPDYFGALHFSSDFSCLFQSAFLPKMTPDYGRVNYIKSITKKYDTKGVNSLFRYMAASSDYLQAYDYCNHFTYVGDFINGSALEYALAIDLVELRKLADTAMNGTSMRVNAIHFVTSSKGIEMLISIFKPLLSSKIGDRIHVHTSYESLYEWIPKEILPQDCGGCEKPMSELTENMFKEMNSSGFLEYRKEMLQARTNEALRPTETFNNEYMGMSGTFRGLNVD